MQSEITKTLKKKRNVIHEAVHRPHIARVNAQENQSIFWGKLGVTQSGGSRYENDRAMDKPLRMLLALHVSGILTNDDLSTLHSVV